MRAPNEGRGRWVRRSRRPPFRSPHCRQSPAFTAYRRAAPRAPRSACTVAPRRRAPARSVLTGPQPYWVGFRGLDWYLDARRHRRRRRTSQRDRRLPPSARRSGFRHRRGRGGRVRTAVQPPPPCAGPGVGEPHLGRGVPVLEVRDLGPGFELDAARGRPPAAQTGGRGLFIASRVRADRWRLPPGRPAGPWCGRSSTSSTRITELRPPARPPGLDSPTSTRPSPGRGFGREPFLRALVVQLAQALERNGGPALAEACVAQVGIDVGSQMEAEFRAAERGRRPAGPIAARRVLRPAQARHRRRASTSSRSPTSASSSAPTPARSATSSARPRRSAA